MVAWFTVRPSLAQISSMRLLIWFTMGLRSEQFSAVQGSDLKRTDHNRWRRFLRHAGASADGAPGRCLPACSTSPGMQLRSKHIVAGLPMPWEPACPSVGQPGRAPHLRKSSSRVWLRSERSLVEYFSLQMQMMGTRVFLIVCRGPRRAVQGTTGRVWHARRLAGCVRVCI